MKRSSKWWLLFFLLLLMRGLEVSRPVSGYASFYFQKGEDMEKKGRDLEAVTFYRQALRHNPDHLQTNYRLAQLFRKLNRDQEKLALYKKLDQLGFRHDPAVYVDLGRDAAQAGDSGKAIRYYEQTLAIVHIYQSDEEKLLCAKAHFYLAEEYAKAQDYQTAVHHLERTLILNPDFEGAQQRLTELESRQASP